MIKKRKYKNNDGSIRYSKNYYYDFCLKGHRYAGSTLTSNRGEALLVAENIRKKAFNKLVLNIKNPSFVELSEFFNKENAITIASFNTSRKSKYKNMFAEGVNFFRDKEFNIENTYKFFTHIEKVRKLSKVSVCDYIDALSAACSYAVNRGELQENFIPKMHLKEYKKEKKKDRIRFLSKQEYATLMQLAQQYHSDIIDHIYFAMNTGLRLSEQLELTQDRIDLVSNTIYIDKTKTDKPRRLKLQNDKLIAILQARKHLEQPFKISKGTLHYKWKNLLKKAEIEEFRWHDLRHTFASWAIMGWHPWQNGSMNIFYLQKYLGHEELKITEKYAHLAEDFLITKEI